MTAASRPPAAYPGVFAILLAAGESTRMGRPKPLLPWLGTTLVAHQVRELLRGGVEHVVVVLGHEAEQVAEQLRGVSGASWVVNDRYKDGMSTSVVVGELGVPDSAVALVVQSVDRPTSAEVIRSLVAAHLDQEGLITVPVQDGRRGHPAVFSASLRAEIRAISEERQGLREVVRRHRDGTVEVSLSESEIFFNLNTPEDYRAILKYYRPGTETS